MSQQLADRDRLLSFLVTLVDKLGGEIKLTQQEINELRCKNIAVTIGPHSEYFVLKVISGGAPDIRPFEQLLEGKRSLL